MLTAAELRGLETLSASGECTVSEFADNLGRSRSYASELLAALTNKGFVVTRPDGREKHVHLTDSRAIEEFERLRRRHGHVDLTTLLGGATLRLVYFLNEPRPVTTLATRAAVHQSTVYRRLDPLVERGIVREAESGYVLTDAFSDLSTFAQEVAHHSHRQRFDEHVDGFVLLWETLDECLAETDDPIDDERFHETGPRLFSEYDLPLFVRDRYHYWYAPEVETVSPADLCCHMLLADAGSRSKSYCLLLLAEVTLDSSTLRERAAKYAVEAAVEDLLAYLETRGETRAVDLPRWEEFEELAADYDVDLGTAVIG